jgi:hypothetical protein
MRVVSSGRDDDLAEVEAYSLAILKAALETGANRVLCDERNLEYAISFIDTYKLAEYASGMAAHLARIAIVCNPAYINDGKFYETVASNRGLIVRVTTNMMEAIEWLEMKS